MRRTVEFAAAFALAASAALAGCTDQTLPLEPANGNAESFFTQAPAPGFDVLRRNAPLTAAVSATGVIGPEGGEIALQGAGISLVVPPGALSESTEITVHAPIGDAVAFQFAPHGLVFDVPASIQVDSRMTNADRFLDETERGGSPLDHIMGVYFTGDPGVGVEPLENLEAYFRDGSIVFDIGHFSGYACASG